MIVAPDYPNMAEVHERILAGKDTEHTTFIRKNDNTLKGVCEVLGVEIPEFISGWRLNGEPFHFGGEAYLSEALSTMDYIIVYGTPDSTVSKFWQTKATRFPYDVMYGSKIELNIAKPKKTRKKITRKVDA